MARETEGRMTKDAFHALLTDPATGQKLDAMLADCATVDALLAGPLGCCADFARVIACDEIEDLWECALCARRWSAPCR